MLHAAADAIAIGLTRPLAKKSAFLREGFYLSLKPLQVVNTGTVSPKMPVLESGQLAQPGDEKPPCLNALQKKPLR